jgi:hypothetical protein
MQQQSCKRARGDLPRPVALRGGRGQGRREGGGGNRAESKHRLCRGSRRGTRRPRSSVPRARFFAALRMTEKAALTEECHPERLALRSLGEAGSEGSRCREFSSSLCTWKGAFDEGKPMSRSPRRFALAAPAPGLAALYHERWKGVPARRKELQIRTLVARRERYREMMGTVDNAGARTPEVGLNSPPEMSH